MQRGQRRVPHGQDAGLRGPDGLGRRRRALGADAPRPRPDGGRVCRGPLYGPAAVQRPRPRHAFRHRAGDGYVRPIPHAAPVRLVHLDQVPRLWAVDQRLRQHARGPALLAAALVRRQIDTVQAPSQAAPRRHLRRAHRRNLFCSARRPRGPRPRFRRVSRRDRRRRGAALRALARSALLPRAVLALCTAARIAKKARRQGRRLEARFGARPGHRVRLSNRHDRRLLTTSRATGIPKPPCQ
mmetsp:Transcript_13316/g.44515  ORF Transcript_13316/g.44515 Transcript_13316/m.44515 type:complete len:241 (+) Transcript_13316:1186-1908(+)